MGVTAVRLAEAERRCARMGGRMTPLRRRVLEIVLRAEGPVGAYEVLDVLAGDGRRPAPPTVYRALDFLMAQNLVHKVHSLNAYLACAQGHEGAHAAELFICRTCGATRELVRDALRHQLDADAAELDFAPESLVVEVQGLCRDCRTGA